MAGRTRSQVRKDCWTAINHCGSVGLRNFTSALNLGYAINDLRDFDLGELNQEEAFGLLFKLCESGDVAMDDGIVQYTLDKLHWNIPYFIQIIFSKIAENGGGADMKINREDVDKAYNELYRTHFLDTWSERLSEYGEFEPYARQILKFLSSYPAGLTRSSIFNQLMTSRDAGEQESVDYILSQVLRMLENDGYLIKQDSIRAFRSPLLRDFWHERFVE